jgi:tight adherence protein C
MKSAGQVGNRMAVRDPSQLSALRQKLIQAGFMSREAVAVYLGARFTCLALATGSAFLILPWIALKGGNLGALVLVASVEAGLALDAAVNRVTDEMVRRHPNLAEQLRILTLELRAGRSRKEAWSALADRLGLDEARAFATMLRQTEEMGTSLGETLTVFSDEMRTKRMLRAEEKAMALPAKLIVPLILFIFPCLMGVLMLPVIFRISHLFPK